MQKITAILLSFLFLTVSWAKSVKLTEDLDDDRVHDTVFFNDEKSILVYQLSSQNFKPVESLPIKITNESFTSLYAGRDGFCFKSGWVKSEHISCFSYEAKTGKFRLNLIAQDERENTENPDELTSSSVVDLRTGGYEASCSYYDSEGIKRKILSIYATIPFPPTYLEDFSGKIYSDYSTRQRKILHWHIEWETTTKWVEILETHEIREIALSDSLLARLRKITQSEYDSRKQESAHLRHEPYPVVTDIDSASRMLGGKLKETTVVSVKNQNYTRYKIIFNDGIKLNLERVPYKDINDLVYYLPQFIAYFPQLEILLFKGVYGEDLSLDLNDSTSGLPATEGSPYARKTGNNPYDHSVSPDKEFRITGFDGGFWEKDLVQSCRKRFLEKWDARQKKYTLSANLSELVFIGENPFSCSSENWIWTGNRRLIFTHHFRKNAAAPENTEFYEMELVEY